MANLTTLEGYDMSEESRAFVEGREAGLAGASDTENPYKLGTDEAMDWEDGRLSTQGDGFFD